MVWRSSKKFFYRGLGVLLPTVLTIWILFIVYQFVQQKIAAPINAGIKIALVQWVQYPAVDEVEILDYEAELVASNDEARSARRQTYRQLKGYGDEAQLRAWLEQGTRGAKLNRLWDQYSIAFNAIGLVVAVVVIYFIGLLFTSFIGRSLHAKGEEILNRVPLIRNVYPSVKQVTDFLFGGESKIQFNKVVAVQYPRKGLWSIGLVTGETMKDIQTQVGQECITVFIPSSPTPFTGYVITVPLTDTVDLPITIEDALKFAVSGGVLIPSGQSLSGQGSPVPQMAATTPVATPNDTKVSPSEAIGDTIEGGSGATEASDQG